MKAEGVRVVVVDGDSGVLANLVGILEGKGYQVHGFSAPRQATGNAAVGSAHVIVTSVDFSGQGDGLAMVASLKETNRQLCAIITTDEPSLDSAVKAMQLGACDYLAKPIESGRLLASVESALARHGMFLTSPETINKMIGSRLRQVRRDQNLTTQQLADRVGVTQSQISQIETGRSAASIVTLYNISQALGMSLSSLLKDI